MHLECNPKTEAVVVINQSPSPIVSLGFIQSYIELLQKALQYEGVAAGLLNDSMVIFDSCLLRSQQRA